ncbi:MAG: regulatory protein RecX [Deltaproteobacteria bacterium]|nr:regulatory protein RecX [Deltaproteobacteria bacterium]
MSRAPVSAWWKAQELLARRAHSTGELIEKLRVRGFSAAETESAIKRLQESRILDDEGFARALTDELCRRRGYGYHVVVQRLRQKKLAPELTENVVRDYFAELGESTLTNLIKDLVERRRPHEGDRKRLFTWLLRRGFRGAEITRALECEPENDF